MGENNKKCIACRYQRCLAIGMDPALVQVRAVRYLELIFKLLILKGSRKRQRKNDANEEEEGDETQSDGAETSEQRELEETDSGVSPQPISSPAVHNPLHSSFSFPFTTTPIIKPDLTSLTFPYTGGDLKTPPVPQRPSVIKRAVREDPAKLQMQADILKFHGNILTHTGNLFSYHADLINKDKPGTSAQTAPGMIKQEIKQEEGGEGGEGGCSFQRQHSAPSYSEYLAVKDEQPPLLMSDLEHEEFSDVLADKIFEEAQELIQNSPWILEPGRFNKQPKLMFVLHILLPAETVSYVESGEAGAEMSKANILSWLHTTTPVSSGRNTESVGTSVLRNSDSSEQKPSHHRSVIQSRETNHL